MEWSGDPQSLQMKSSKHLLKPLRLPLEGNPLLHCSYVTNSPHSAYYSPNTLLLMKAAEKLTKLCVFKWHNNVSVKFLVTRRNIVCNSPPLTFSFPLSLPLSQTHTCFVCLFVWERKSLGLLWRAPVMPLFTNKVDSCTRTCACMSHKRLWRSQDSGYLSQRRRRDKRLREKEVNCRQHMIIEGYQQRWEALTWWLGANWPTVLGKERREKPHTDKSCRPLQRNTLLIILMLERFPR